jgi:hypothetical protein
MPDTSVAAPLPRSVRWFAPWTWSAGKLWLALVLISGPAAYSLSIFVAIMLLERSSVRPETVALAYRPVLCLWHRSPQPVREAFEDSLNSFGYGSSQRVLTHHWLWEYDRVKIHK